MNTQIIFILDLIGVVVFAISGALAAREKQMDIFGAFIIAFVTSVGGGTLRDVMIGSTPVFWMKQPIYITMIFLGTLIALIFKEKIYYLRKSLLLFDTVGIGVFALIGTEIGLSKGFDAPVIIAVGTITACFGGVIRDILCNEIPVIFHREIYAIPCAIGSGIYLLASYLGYHNWVFYFLSITVVILIRLLAIRFKIELPKL